MDKCLIVCYSYSGNTWRVAEEIKRQTGGVLCEIYPRQPYPMQFEALLDQVKEEIESGFTPHLFPITECVADYDTIFVGTPNWRGTVAPPIISFLNKNDMTGKTLLPFSTHCGGGRGSVEQEIQRLCPKAEVKQGISVMNDGGSELSELIALWLKDK